MKPLFGRCMKRSFQESKMHAEWVEVLAVMLLLKDNKKEERNEEIIACWSSGNGCRIDRISMKKDYLYSL